MRTIRLLCVGLLIVLAAASPIAQDAEREAAKERAARAHKEEQVARHALAMATAEAGLAGYHVVRLDWLEARQEPLEELSKVLRALEALRRLEHTQEEREALTEALDNAIGHLGYIDEEWRRSHACEEAWQKLAELTDRWDEEGPEFEESAPQEALARDKLLRLEMLPLSFHELRLRTLNDLMYLVNDVCEEHEAPNLRGLLLMHEAANQAVHAAVASETAARETMDAAGKALDAAQSADAQKAKREEYAACEAALRQAKDLRVSAEERASTLRDRVGNLLIDVETSGMRHQINEAMEEAAAADLRGNPLPRAASIRTGGRISPRDATGITRVFAHIEDDKSVAALEGLRVIEHLEVSIEYSGTEDDVRLKRVLDAAAASPGLSFLSVNLPAGTTAAALQPLAIMKSLKTLRVSAPMLSSSAAKALNDAARGKESSLKWSVVPAAIEEMLPHLDAWPSISVTIDGAAATVPMLGALAKLKNLQSATVVGGLDSEAHWKALAASPSLRGLALTGAMDAERLKGVRHLRGVRSLDLSGDRGFNIEELAGVLSIEFARGLDLEELNLSGCICLDESILDVIDGMKSLKRLDLTHCLSLPEWAASVIKHRVPACTIKPDPTVLLPYRR